MDPVSVAGLAFGAVSVTLDVFDQSVKRESTRTIVVRANRLTRIQCSSSSLR